MSSTFVMRNLEFRHVCDCPCLGISRTTGAVEFIASATDRRQDSQHKWEPTIEARVATFKHWFADVGGKVYTVKTDKSLSIWGVFTEATLDITIYPHDVLGNLDAYVYVNNNTHFNQPCRNFYIHIKDLDKQTDVYRTKDAFYVKLPIMKEPLRSKHAMTVLPPTSRSLSTPVVDTKPDMKPMTTTTTSFPSPVTPSVPLHLRKHASGKRSSWLWW